MKKANIFFIVLFAVCIAVPLVLFNFEKDAVSKADNKMLAELDFSNGIDIDNITDYINERIGLRNEALNVYQLVNDKLFKEMVHPSYTYGKDGYVFFKDFGVNNVGEEFIREFCEYISRIQTYCEERGVPFIYCITPSKATIYSEHLPDGYIYNNKFLKCLRENLDRCGVNNVGEEFIREFCEYISRIQTYCEERGVPFIYCITPSKATIYSEHLPDGYIYNNKFLKCLRENLDRCGVNYVDNAEYLTEVAKTEQIFNKQYDAGHWNDLGEFYGVNNIIKKVQEYFSSVRALQFSDFEITQTEQTSLPVSRFPISENVPALRYVNSDKVTYLTDSFKDLRLTKHFGFSISQTDRNAEDLPSVLFFHGSYFNRNVPLFNFAFGQDYSIHNYENVLDFDYYFNIFQPDCVIFETAEYATTKTYFNFEKMRSKTLNAPLSTLNEADAYKIELANGNAEKLDDLLINQNSGSRLVTLTAKTGDKYSCGYFVDGEYTFDLEINGTEISLTVDAERSDLKNGTLYLFK